MMTIRSFSDSPDKQEFLIRFSKIPRGLYPTRPLPPDEYWILIINQFQELDFELFILEKDGIDIGRIGCNVSKTHTGSGFFGFFEISESEKEHSETMITAAEDWLKQQNINQIIGPIDFNVWLGNRFKTTDARPQYSWEPNNPAFYADLFINSDFKLDQDYISMFYDDSNLCFDRTKTAYDMAIKEGHSFRNLDLKRENEVNTLYELNLKSFCVNYMYEPITKEQYKSIHILGVKKIDLQYSFFIQNSKGREIGYVFSFIDPSGEQIIKSILMDPKYQGARLASALLHAAVKQGRINGHKACIGAMVRKGNVSEHFFDHLQTPTARHEYTLLKKKIS